LLAQCRSVLRDTRQVHPCSSAAPSLALTVPKNAAAPRLSNTEQVHFVRCSKLTKPHFKFVFKINGALDMLANLPPFLIHWIITSLSLWVASYVFAGIKFTDTSSLVISALLLGFANAIVKPLLILFTLPLTLITFGFFLLVINALMILLVSSFVRGFVVSGFWTAFFASIFISVLSFLIGSFLIGGKTFR
jgi:putative membrane protein